MEEIKQKRKKKYVSSAFKFMVAVGSVAGTIGVWDVLANKDLSQANVQPILTPTTEVKPLPTLVSLVTIETRTNKVEEVVTKNQPVIRDVVVDTTPKNVAPVSSAGEVIVLSAPVSEPAPEPPPAPVTTTQSSKK